MASHDATGPDKAGKKGSNRLQCVVVTPERTLLDDVADFVVLPLSDGELGILPNRSPLIGRLGFGELRTKHANETRRYFVDGGFAQVRDNVITVLTNRAIPAAQVDTATANRELEEAKARHASTEFENTERSRAIARAQAQLRVGAKG